MNFTITANAKDFIIAYDSQITVSMEKEETCACCGPRKTSFLSGRAGQPEDVTESYQTILHDGVKVYLHDSLKVIASSPELVIDLDAFNELVITK